MKSEENIFILSNEHNYFMKIKCPYLDLCKSYCNLINFYISYSIENMNIKDTDIFYTGINVVHHIFRIMILYTKNLELSFYNTQQSIYYYVEYISQITDREDNIFFNLSIKDAVIYVYTRTIFEIRKQYVKKESETDNTILSNFKNFSHNYLTLVNIVSKYLFDLSNDEIKKHISDIYLLFMKVDNDNNELFDITNISNLNDCIEFLNSRVIVKN